MSEISIPAEDLADLYDNAPCGYVSISATNHIVKINRTLLDWLNKTADDLLGESLHSILSFGAKIAFETHLAPLLRLQGFVHEIALDIVDCSGNKIPVIANAAERCDSQGQHQFTRLTMFKAVDRLTFERSLIEARLKAEAQAQSEHDALELRDQFLAVLGHDLRNPLAATLAGIALLKRRENSTERELLIMREMEASIGRANRLIDDVLDFARGKLGGGIKLSRERSRPLQPIVEQVLGEIRAVHRNRIFDVRINMSDNVDCDPDRIAQLAANLLSNAVAHGAADSAIEIDMHTTDEEFLFSVANGGTPISDAVRDKLFQPFFRGDATTKRNGLGLGLFIVNEIATAHGGAMEVFSDQNQTRFTFKMPRRTESVQVI